MHSNQQAPAILACRTGDSFLKRAVISDLLIVFPPDCFQEFKKYITPASFA